MPLPTRRAQSSTDQRNDALSTLLYDLETDGLSPVEIERAAAAFRRHDADRRGVLSPRSFGAVVGKLAKADGHEYTDDELAGLLRRADLDADGEVDFHELLQLLARQKRILKAQARVNDMRNARHQQRAEEVATEEARRQREEAEANEARAAQLATEEAALRSAAAAEKREAAEREAAAEVAAKAARAHDEESFAQGREVAYTDSLRMELETNLVLLSMPHLTSEAVDAAIAVYSKFETRRDGRLRRDDFVKAMKAYGKAVGQQSAYKTELLLRAFTTADTDHHDSLSIGDFLGYLTQGGRLHVDPSALAAAAGVQSEPGHHGGSGSGNPARDGTNVNMNDPYVRGLFAEIKSSGVLAELPHLSTSDVEACVAFYQAFDEDADGHLTPREFERGFKAYGRATGSSDAYRRSLLREVFNSADVSKDALLEVSEFVRFVGKNGKMNLRAAAMKRAATEWNELKSFKQGEDSVNIFGARSSGSGGSDAAGGFDPIGTGGWQAQQALLWRQQQAAKAKEQEAVQATAKATNPVRGAVFGRMANGVLNSAVSGGLSGAAVASTIYGAKPSKAKANEGRGRALDAVDDRVFADIESLHETVGAKGAAAANAAGAVTKTAFGVATGAVNIFGDMIGASRDVVKQAPIKNKVIRGDPAPGAKSHDFSRFIRTDKQPGVDRTANAMMNVKDKVGSRVFNGALSVFEVI